MIEHLETHSTHQTRFLWLFDSENDGPETPHILATVQKLIMDIKM